MLALQEFRLCRNIGGDVREGGRAGGREGGMNENEWDAEMLASHKAYLEAARRCLRSCCSGRWTRSGRSTMR